MLGRQNAITQAGIKVASALWSRPRAHIVLAGAVEYLHL